MIQFVPDTNKSGKEKGRGSLNVWIQQATGLLTSCDWGTYLLWSVDVVIVNIRISHLSIVDITSTLLVCSFIVVLCCLEENMRNSSLQWFSVALTQPTTQCTSLTK